MEKNHSGPYVYYRWLVLLLASGLCLLPLWATVMGGFKTSGELRTNAFGLPRQWLFDNYVSIAMSGRFWQMLGNSAFIAFVTVVLTLLVSSMAAFVLAHLRFGKRWLANYLALGLTFPFASKDPLAFKHYIRATSSNVGKRLHFFATILLSEDRDPG